MGNGLPLNGRGGFKSHGPKSVFNVWVQVEVLEPDSRFRRLGFACVLGVLFFHVSKVRRIPAPSRMFVIHPSSPTPTSVMNSTPTTLVFSKVVMGLLALVLGSPWAMATHLVNWWLDGVKLPPEVRASRFKSVRQNGPGFQD